MKRQALFSVYVLMVGVAVSLSLQAFAQTDFGVPSEETIAASGITFPIPELGNCANKAACHTYCDSPENIDACVAFAKQRGLMNDEEVSRAERFAKELREQGGGPGGCTTPATCKVYCENITHIDECIAFAERQGVSDSHIEEGKKIQEYLASGGQMPGGCTSRASCEQYCSDFTHARECFAFAKGAGLAVAQGDFDGLRDGDIGPGPEHLEKLMELAASGEMPGGCTSKQSCDAYCRDESHVDECVAFGVKAGFISPEQAEKIKAIGGKGPGGCASEASCRTFCNDPANRDTCFTFAKEHNLLPPKALEHAEEGLIRVKQGFADAPPEVRACLESVLGTNVIRDIQEGILAPGPEIGERMRACFEKFGSESRPEAAFRNVPDEIAPCLKERLGSTFEEIQTGALRPTPEIADMFRSCFESMHQGSGMYPQGPGGYTPGSDGSEGYAPRPIKGDERLCIQVIAPAYNPATGECKEFPTPCDVPPGWTPGCGNAEFRNTLEHMTPSPGSDGMMYNMMQTQEQHQKQFEGQFQQQYEEQYRQEFQRQFEEQYKQQLEQQYQEQREFYEPSGAMPPSSGVRSFLGSALYLLKSFFFGDAR